MASAASDTGNSRVQALAAANMAMTASSLVDSAGQLAAGNLTGVKVSVSLGSTKSESQSTSQSSTVVGSGISGRNVALTATGDGANSTIAVTGSDITASHNASLKADGQVNLQSATNTVEQHSTNSSSGWSVGVGFAFGGQQNGFTIEASASKSRGNADGKDTVHSNSHLTAGGTVNIQSGGDTTLKGAVVAGQTVKADVGGNLNVESLQDTSQYDAQQKSTGVGISLCIPPICYGTSSLSVNASKYKVEGDFASVTEQSGIKAGDGGFQIDVKGNTDLKGAVITSTDKATDENKNTLTTATLTQSDIHNKDIFNANGYSFSATVSGSLGDQSTAATPADRAAAANAANTKPSGSAGIGSASGSQSSTTSSGISAGALTITDSDKQTALTGKEAKDTVASINRDVATGKDTSAAIGKAWDGDKLMKDVQAQTQITSAFGQAASKYVGDYAEKQYQAAMDRKDLAEADKWKEGGAYRVALHAGVGALTGGLQGALGAGASALAVTAIADTVDAMGLPKPVRDALIAAGGAGVGAMAGGAAGAAGGFNQTINNYLRHTEQVSRYQADKACQAGDAASCKVRNDLDALSQKRQTELVQACVAGSAATCRANVDQAGSDYYGMYLYGQELDKFIAQSTDPYQVQQLKAIKAQNDLHMQQAGNIIKTDLSEILQNKGGLTVGERNLLASLNAATTGQGATDALMGAGIATTVGLNRVAKPVVQARSADTVQASAIASQGSPDFGAPAHGYGTITYKDANGNVIPAGHVVPGTSGTPNLSAGDSPKPLSIHDIAGPVSFALADQSQIISGQNAGVRLGAWGESLANDVLQTLSPGTRPIQNNAGHGSDSVGGTIDTVNKTIPAFEIKATDTGTRQAVDNLASRTEAWIRAAADGAINHKPVSAADRAHAIHLRELLDRGYTIKPYVVEVAVPAEGQSARPTVTVIPWPRPKPMPLPTAAR